MVCCHCGISRNINMFHKAGKDKNGTQKYHSTCNLCRKLSAHVYYANNKDLIIKRTNLWKKYNTDRVCAISRRQYKKNPAIRIAATRKWQRKNMDMVRATQRKSNAKTRKTIIGKINHSISGGIYKSIRRNKKGYNWELLVGYTAKQLKNHLESMFTNEMTWDKFMNGEIHIDHIIPRSFFKFDSFDDVEFKYCWSLNNLQPLWAKENLVKSNKIKEVA